MKKMKNNKKLSAMLACALISSCVAVTFGSCGGGEAKDTYVPDEKPYRWANTPAVQAEKIGREAGRARV